VVKIENPLTIQHAIHKFTTFSLGVVICLSISNTNLYSSQKNGADLVFNRTPTTIVVSNKTRQNITNFIQDRNPQISDEVALKYAKKIIEESKKNGISHNILTILLGSESDFECKPKHPNHRMCGMGGIDYEIWGDILKEAKIIHSKKDLFNPLINIEASAYILSIYMSTKKTTLHAIACYKGGTYSRGKSQALYVLRKATILKRNERLV